MSFSSAKQHFRQAQEATKGNEAMGVREIAQGLQELAEAIERSLADIHADVKRVKSR